MLVAVAAASPYTHHMQAQITRYNHIVSSNLLTRIAVPANNGLRHEMDIWLNGLE